MKAKGAGGPSWAPESYSSEAELHDLVVRTPQILPLSGSPHVVVIGREVSLPDAGYVDVLAIEDTGRPVIIEVKLDRNSEARRAVVAQALSYAASLHLLARETFERVLSRTLGGRSLYDFVREQAQGLEVTEAEFNENLEQSLSSGSFRVVVVLNEAPAALISLFGYLEAVTQNTVLLDLITVQSYSVGGQRLAVPQRVDPLRRPEPDPVDQPNSRHIAGGRLVTGVDAFAEGNDEARAEYRETLTMFERAARRIAKLPTVKVDTYFGTSGLVSLMPRFRTGNSGMVTFYRGADGRPSVQLWRSVIDRHVPALAAEIEALIGKEVGQGTAVSSDLEPLVELIVRGYEAAR